MFCLSPCFCLSVGLLAKEYINAFLMHYRNAERHKTKQKDHLFSVSSPEVTTEDGGIYNLFSPLPVLHTCTCTYAHVLVPYFLFYT